MYTLLVVVWEHGEIVDIWEHCFPDWKSVLKMAASLYYRQVRNGRSFEMQWGDYGIPFQSRYVKFTN